MANKNKMIAFVLCLLLFGILNACSEDGPSPVSLGSNTTPVPEDISTQIITGTIQKGPFIKGGTVQGAMLQPDGSKSTKSSNTIINQSGKYHFKLDWEGATELTATGLYIDERTGLPSTNPITLRSITSGLGNEESNINSFTHLATERALQISQSNGDFIEKSWQTSKVELSKTLGLDTDAIDSLNAFGTNSTQYESASASLLLFSAAIMELADSETALTVEMILRDLSNEFSAHGLLPYNSESVLYDIAEKASQIDLDADISSNVDIGGISHTSLFTNTPSTMITWRALPYLNGVTHILITGQSLALAGRGEPALTLTPSNSHLMFNGGVINPGTVLELSTLVGLFESVRETVASGAANYITNLFSTFKNVDNVSRPEFLMSISGKSGAFLAEIDKQGGDSFGVYATALNQVIAGQSLVHIKSKKYNFGGIFFIQGERDAYGPTGEYRTRLMQLRKDYESDIASIIGKSQSVPLFTYQTSSKPDEPSEPSVPIEQLAAAEADEDIYMIGPIYHLPYSQLSEVDVHLTNHGYRWLGHYFAKAFTKTIYEGISWKPLSPISIVADGAVLTVKFHVPYPPLVFDTVTVTNPGYYGFRITNNGQDLAINSVVISGIDSITITATAPIPPGSSLKYARNGDFPVGAVTGARGNLRDSDPLVSNSLNSDGKPYPLYNWCVIFDKSIIINNN